MNDTEDNYKYQIRRFVQGDRIRARWFVTVVAVAVTAGLVTPSFGHESSAELRERMADTEAQLAEQAQRQKQAQVQLDAVEQQIPDAQTRFETADRQLHDAEARLASLEEQLAAARDAEVAAEQRLTRTQRQYAGAVERLVATMAELAAERGALAQQAAAFYKYGTTAGKRAVLQSLSSSVSVSELTHQVHVAGEVADHQARIVERVAQLEARASGERDRLGELQQAHDLAAAEAVAARATAERLAAEQQVQVAQLEVVRADRQAALAELQADAVAAQAAIEELEEESNAIAAQLQALASAEADARAREEEERRRQEEERRRQEEERRRQQQEQESSSGDTSGDGSSDDAGTSEKFQWPANGPVTSPYGYRTHPISGERRLHAGIDIGAPNGSSIVAAEAGEVVYAGWYGGYGLATVINHGDGIATLYAHQSSLSVATGQRVSKGQRIGAVGSTGYSTGPHLHFEVRVNGEPVDPMPYF